MFNEELSGKSDDRFAVPEALVLACAEEGAEQGITFADRSVVKKRKIEFALDRTSSSAAPRSTLAPTVSAILLPSLTTAVTSSVLEPAASASVRHKPSSGPLTHKGSTSKVAALITPTRKVAAVHVPLADSRVALDSQPAKTAQGREKGTKNITRSRRTDGTARRGQ
ncbi:hypothetical protein E8E12_011627 [Didymella heteroderae]|uniref:Uncharacterized protein n=1 Tax=Didymella heteroderae TaxID=1769908 RepID=A0A9P5C6V3_9PLEO|nr:hypothetical protein E8E12_011627 [Didymella heteroderae]